MVCYTKFSTPFQPQKNVNLCKDCYSLVCLIWVLTCVFNLLFNRSNLRNANYTYNILSRRQKDSKVIFCPWDITRNITENKNKTWHIQSCHINYQKCTPLPTKILKDKFVCRPSSAQSILPPCSQILTSKMFTIYSLCSHKGQFLL